MAPVYDVVQSFALTALCEGRRFAPVNRMREDPTVCELLGIEAVVGDDTIRRFFASLDPKSSAQWVARAAASMWGALPEHLILAWGFDGFTSRKRAVSELATRLLLLVCNLSRISGTVQEHSDPARRADFRRMLLRG